MSAFNSYQLENMDGDKIKIIASINKDIAIMTDTFVDLVSDIPFVSSLNVSRRFVWILEETG